MNTAFGSESLLGPGIADTIAGTPGVSLRGVFGHAGHGYHEAAPEGVAAVGRSEGAILSAAAAAIRSAGMPISEVSVGSTPTARHAMREAGVTECRPGNYVFHDASQASLQTCRIEDCAMTVAATVVSVPDARRAVLDAGSKTLSSDALRPRAGGHGFLIGRESRIARLSEEHGVIDRHAGRGNLWRGGARRDDRHGGTRRSPR